MSGKAVYVVAVIVCLLMSALLVFVDGGTLAVEEFSGAELPTAKNSTGDVAGVQNDHLQGSAVSSPDVGGLVEDPESHEIAEVIESSPPPLPAGLPEAPEPTPLYKVGDGGYSTTGVGAKTVTGKTGKIALPFSYDMNFSVEPLLVTPGAGVKYTMADLAALYPDQVWEISAGVYQVNESITIRAGDALEIYPGEVIYFNGSRGLYIDGILWANGTGTNPIVMENLTATGWEGVYLNSTAGGSTFGNVTVKNAMYGLRISGITADIWDIKMSGLTYGVYVTAGATVNVFNITISNTWCGIFYGNSAGSVVGGTFSSCSYGIFVSDSDVDIYSIEVFSTVYGIYIWGASSSSATHLTAVDGTYGIVLDASGSVVVSNVNVTNNTEAGIYVVSGTPEISNVTGTMNGQVSVSGGGTATIYSQNFEAASFSAIGWSVVTNSGSSWTLSDYNGDGDKEANAWYGFPTETILYSPLINCTAYTGVTLTFWEDWYTGYPGGSQVGYVKVSNDSGATWTTVHTNVYGSSHQGTVTIDISSIADGNIIQVQFYFYSYDDWWWGIDDFAITGTEPLTLQPVAGTGAVVIDGGNPTIKNITMGDNLGYALYSNVNWDWNGVGDSTVTNDEISIDGDVRVQADEQLILYNIDMDVRDVIIKGLMAVDDSTGTVITNNVVVDGTLYLNATTWEIAASYNGEYFVKVNTSGTMIIQNGSSVVSLDGNTAYDFWAYSGSTLHVLNSTIGNVGYSDYSDPEGNHTGLWINTTSVKFYNATFQRLLWGVILHAQFNTLTFAYCSFIDSYYGVTNIWYDGAQYRYTSQGSIYFQFTTMDNNEAGTYIRSTSGVYVNGSSISRNTYGLYVFLSDGIYVNNSNIFDNQQYGVFIWSTNEVYVNNSNISNNGLVGLYLDRVNSATVTGNTMYQTNYGVYAPLSNITAQSNSVVDNYAGVCVVNMVWNATYHITTEIYNNTFSLNTYAYYLFNYFDSKEYENAQASVRADVYSNTFSENDYSIYIVDYSISPSTDYAASVELNTSYNIYDNTITNGTWGIIYIGNLVANNATQSLSCNILVSRNTIISSKNGIGVAVYVASAVSSAIADVYATISDNHVQDPYAQTQYGIYTHLSVDDTAPASSSVGITYVISGNTITMSDAGYAIYSDMNSTAVGTNSTLIQDIYSNAISHADHGVYIDYQQSTNISKSVSIHDNVITLMTWRGISILEVDMSTSEYTIYGNDISQCHYGIYVYASESVYVSSTGLNGNVVNYNYYGMYLTSPVNVTLVLTQNANNFDSNTYGVYVRGDYMAVVSMLGESFWNESYAAVYIKSAGGLADVDISSSNFYTVGRGIMVEDTDNASLDIANNDISDATYAGIYISVNVWTAGRITGNTLSGCLRYGIYVDHGADLEISYNTISSSVWNSGYAAIYVTIGSFYVAHNTLSYNGYLGISASSTDALTLEYNLVENTGVYRYGSEWGISVVNCADLRSTGNTIRDNQNGYYIQDTTFVMTDDTIESNDGYGVYITSSRGSVINCRIASNVGTGLYATSSSDVNMFADAGTLTVEMDEAYFYGNLTALNGGTVVLKYGEVYLGSVAHNEVGVYVESDGALMSFDSLIDSWSGYYYLFQIRGPSALQGTVIDTPYAVEVYTPVTIVECEFRNAGLAGLMVMGVDGLVVESSVFRWCNVGIIVDGVSLRINSGLFDGNGVGIQAEDATLYIIGAGFYNNMDSAVYVSGGSATITSAHFDGNHRAIYAASAALILDGIEAFDNYYGIYAENSQIEMAEPYFSGNAYGIMATGNSSIMVDTGTLYDTLSVYAKDTSIVTLVKCSFDRYSLLATEAGVINVLDEISVTVVNFDGTPVPGAEVIFNGTMGNYSATLPEGEAGLTMMIGQMTAAGWADANYTITYTNGFIVREVEWDGSATVTLVLNTDSPEAVAPPMPIEAVEGEQMTFAFVLDDGDIPYGDVMTYEVLYGPEGLVIDNGTIVWTPTCEYAGTTTYVTVRITDSCGASTVTTIYIAVGAVNGAPQIAQILATPVNDGYVQFLVLCNDPDGEMVNATLVIDDTIVVPLTPAGPAADGYYYSARVRLSEGTHTYRVIVSDGEAVVESESKTVDVPMNLTPYIAIIALLAAVILLYAFVRKRRPETMPTSVEEIPAEEQGTTEAVGAETESPAENEEQTTL